MSQVATEVVVDPAVPMLTENALVVLKDRYLNRKDGVLTEEPFGLFSRVARYVASAEQNDANEELWYQRFLNGMLEGRFMPNSPTLMNAGRNNNLLSACYVLPVSDSIDNIFDSVKATGLVQRAGGGCVAGDAQVFVRGKGLTRIADLCAILPRPDVDGVFVDVKDIEVLTADNYGKICFRPVTRVWRFVDKKTRNIATSYGTLTASKEHPCFVVGKDGPSFVPAEDTGAGTALVRPTPYTNQIELDQRAYLAGMIVGDGLVSEGKNGRPDRLRIFSGDEATLNVVKDYVFNLCGKPYSVHASGATVYELTVLDKSLIAEAKQWIGVGAKNDIPGFNPASLHEAASYIAGLIDSDGHVEASRPRVSISSVHRELCERVQGVLGVLGCPTRLRERLPGKRGTRNCYEVTFAAHDVPWLPALLNRKFRKDRLVNWLASPDSRVVQTPDWVRDKILASGKFDSTRSDTRGTLGSGPDVQSLVYSQTKSTSRRNLSSIADNLDDSAISHLANAISVKEVTSDVATDLYDLTVSEFSRYVVVCGGLPAIVHNTGYAFDELRPCGQYVSSSGGKSSGPLSFWRVFSEATSAIQQGCVVGSTLIATDAGVFPIKDLVGKQPWVFTYSRDKGRIALEQAAEVFETKKNAEVWKLTTDKGLELFATPDHLILCRDGVDRRLDSLESGMSLMAFTRYQSGDNIRVILQDGKDTRCTQHRLVAADYFGKSFEELNGFDIHHKNRDHFDDTVSNLEIITRSEHMAEHGRTERVERMRQLSKDYPKFGASNGMHSSNFFANKSVEEIDAYRKRVSAGISRSNSMHNPVTVKKHPLFNNPESKLDAKKGKALAAVAALYRKGLDVATPAAWMKNRDTLPNQHQYTDATLLELFGSWEDLLGHVYRREKTYLNRKAALMDAYAAMLNAGFVIATDEDWCEALRAFPEFPVKKYGIKAIRAEYGDIHKLVSALSTALDGSNHKVVSVEFSHYEDVYDMTVPGSNHFVVVTDTSATSCGIVIHNSFRRGANMAVMSVHHPDIVKFLFAKQDLKQFENYNISVKVPDSFMEQLKENPASLHVVSWKDKNWYIPRAIVDKCKTAVADGISGKVHPRTLDTCYQLSDLVPDTTPDISDCLSVGDIFDIILKNAWQTGEPGLFFISRVRETEALPDVMPIQATNPCVTGDTLVAVADGRGCVPIKQLAEEGKAVPVWCCDPASGSVNIRMGRNPRLTRQAMQLYRVELDDGSYIRATDDHKFLQAGGHVVKCKDLQLDMSLMGFEQESKETFAVKPRTPKVVAVSRDKVEDVYNITVDEFHTVAYVTTQITDQRLHGTLHQTGIYTANCGEQPLGPWESCNLASINLAKYVKPITDRITEQGSFDDVDMVALGDDVDMVVRFLDNVVTVNNHPVKEIVAANDANRRIGLGIMGFADMLVQLGIRYDSPEGIEFGRNLMSFINNRAVNASINLAKERGAFPNYDKSVWPKRLNGAPIRNACVTTVAPTGTISIIADCSGGIEPLFSFAFYRYVLGDKKLVEVNKNFKALAKLYGFDKPEVYEYVATNGTVQGCPDIPDNIKNILRSARDISPEDHIKMQAAFQEHVTSAISKTINLPESASLDDVRTAYITAYNLRCKGVTVYRDNCRSGQPMALKQAAKDKEEVPSITNKKLSNMQTLMPGLYYKHKCTYGTMHINVSFESLPDGTWRECQVFFEIGRSGDPLNAMLDAVARLCSKLLQTGAGLEVIIDQLSGGKSLGEKHNVNGLTTSLPNEIAAGLLAYYAATIDCRNSDGLITCMPWSGLGLSASDGNTCSSPSSAAPTSIVKDLSRKINAVDMLSTPCPSPNCRGTLVIAEGCKKCYSCGQSSC